MKILDNIQKAIFEIRSLIEANAEVRKLVLIDSDDALEAETPSINDSRKHFTVAAVFDTTKPPFNKNTIVSIVLNKANYNEEDLITRGILKINILTRSELWELRNQKVRPLEIANIVSTMLNNRKISSSHKLAFSGIELIVLNENISGYSVTFFVEEGSGLDEQF